MKYVPGYSVSVNTMERVCQALLQEEDGTAATDEGIARTLGLSPCAVARARTVLERRRRMRGDNSRG